MKKYLLSFLLTFFSLTLIGLGINYYIDPLWLFEHTHQLNRFQYGFDTRKQKSHRLYFGRQQYDALLLGSSRLVAAQPADFHHENLFNGAVEAMQHWEFKHHLAFFIKAKGEPKTVYIGLDFLDSGSPKALTNKSVYWSDLDQWGYRWRMLMSLDALRYAIRGANYSHQVTQFPGDKLMYSRDGYQLDRLYSLEESNQRRKTDLINFRQQIANFEYQPQMLKSIQSIREHYPGIELVLFSTPISNTLYDLYQQENLITTYRTWLCQMSQEADQFYDFMGDNLVTANISNFADAHHAYGRALSVVSQCVSEGFCPEQLRQQILSFKTDCTTPQTVTYR